jgi:hypothetical protein
MRGNPRARSGIDLIHSKLAATTLRAELKVGYWHMRYMPDCRLSNYCGHALWTRRRD